MLANMLKVIMGGVNWSLIDIMRVRSACSAELEDRIEEILLDVQFHQLPKEFDIRAADLDVQTTLAAYIKRLCLRQQKANDARMYFRTMQQTPIREPRNEQAQRVYQHAADILGRKETMTVSLERDKLPAVPEQRGPIRRVRRARRRPSKA